MRILDVIRVTNIPVQDAVPMQIGQRLQDLQDKVHAPKDRLVAGGLVEGNRRREELHREVGLPVVVKTIVKHADYMRVAQAGQGPELLGQVQAERLYFRTRRRFAYTNHCGLPRVRGPGWFHLGRGSFAARRQPLLSRQRAGQAKACCPRAKRAQRRLDVSPIRCHDLRHTHASLLLRDKVPIKVVSERLGHSNPAFTMTTYQHVLPGMQDDAAAAFGQLLANHSRKSGEGAAAA